jgi:hypothetical protein
MSLKDQMAADMTDVFLNVDEFADSARFTVKGVTDTFVVLVVIGDPTPGFLSIDGGQEQKRPVAIYARQTALRTGISGITGVARDPIKGDSLIIDTGAYAGTWIVQTAQPDDGDAMLMQCVNATLYAAGGKDAREVR